MRNTRKTISITLSVVALAALGLYSLFQFSDFIAGPRITIDKPSNGASVETPDVIISGSAYNISQIQLNDRDIFIDEEGAFTESLLLAHGYNVIELTGRDRFGRERKAILELIYK